MRFPIQAKQLVQIVLADQHTENNISCISNIHTGSTCKTGNLPSQASQTTAVKQTWSGGSWGACEATACKSGYAVSNGVCTATLCSARTEHSWLLFPVVNESRSAPPMESLG